MPVLPISEKSQIEKILVNYTDECVEDILVNCPFDFRKRYNGRIISKQKIFAYLKEKYGLATNLGKGSPNYWIIRGFSKDFANTEYKKYSSCFDTCSIESISKRHNVSAEEARKILDERIAKSKRTFQETHTPEEIEKISKSKGLTLEKFIQKYGEEGVEKYKAKSKSNSKNVSLEGFIERYGEDEGKKRYEDHCKKQQFFATLEGYIEKYGEIEGTKRWNDIKHKKSVSHTLEGYIEKYGEEEGTKRFKERQEKWQNTLKSKPKEEIESINKRKAITLENLIKKYGEAEGKIRYNEWKQKRFQYILNSVCGVASKESLLVFIPFYNKLLEQGINDEDIFIGIPELDKSEYVIERLGNHSFFMYDFTVISKKLIVEYNGILFHPKSKDDLTWSNPLSNVTCEEAYNKDMLKRKLAEQNGFNFLVLWSDETPEHNLKILEDYYEKNCNDI